MKRKKIKKINEFVDDEFDLEIDNTDLTEEEIKLRKEEHDRVVEENLKDHPKKASIEFMTLEEFREFMEAGVEMDGDDFSEEDLKELNEVCMEYFGQPFRKSNDK